MSSIKFLLDKTNDPCSTAVHADYVGSTTKGFGMHLINSDGSQMKTTLSKIPSATRFDPMFGGGKQFELNATTSVGIGALDVVGRLSPGCDEKKEGKDFIAHAKGVPAGDWKLGWKLGAAGFMGLNPGGSHFEEVEVGITIPGKPERYVSIGFKDSAFGLEWDLDGHLGTEENPYYVYCDGADALWTLRVRWEMFGLGIRPDGGVNHDCDELQVKWYFAPTTIPICNVGFGCVNAGPSLPHFKRTGDLQWNGKPPAVEVLFANHWFRTPERLWGA